MEKNQDLVYQVGQRVEVKSREGADPVIGCIVAITAEDSEVTIELFKKPSELATENLKYYGTKELIKTDIEETIKIEDIIRPVEVLRFIEYLSSEKADNDDVYVFRQLYDSQNNVFLPRHLLKSTSCGRIPNPDDQGVVACNCGSIHYIDSIKLNGNLCDRCGLDVTQDAKINSLLKKRSKSRSTKQSVIPLKKVVSEFTFDQASLDIATEGKDDQEDADHMRKKVKIVSHPKDRRAKDYHKQVMSKTEKTLQKYKQLNQLSNQLPQGERMRYKVREDLFGCLAMGVEEIKLRSHLKDYDEFGESKKSALSLAKLGTEELFQLSKRLALSIESILFHMSDVSSQKKGYNHHARMVLMSLKNLDNFPLRLRIILEELTPVELSSMTEDELAPSKLKHLREEQERMYLASKNVEEPAPSSPKVNEYFEEDLPPIAI